MEDIIFDEYDEYELQKKTKSGKKRRYSTGFRKCALALALAISVSTGFSAVPGRFDNMATVEAAKKKDNKKPVLKLQGAASLQVTQNESVKIPKATAKDNVDGNLTKKIKVSVKCGKKSYEDLAKKIQKNKAVVFTKIGKYVVTYTVSDKAKNKATKKRTVTVVAKAEEGKTTEVATTQSPTTQSQTTENKVTTEQVTTAATTTEAPTTEATTESIEQEEKVMPVEDLSKYGDIEKVTVNGITYNIAKKMNEEAPIISSDEYSKSKIKSDKFDLDNIFSFGFAVGTNSKYNQDNMFYLSFLGNLKVMIENVDLSNNIILHPLSEEKPETVEILVINASNKLVRIMNIQIRYNDFETLKTLFPYSFPESSLCGFTLDEENELIVTPSLREKKVE